MNALAVEGLVAGYDPDLAIVKGVSLGVGTGETVAILGPNGAGKSTLVKTVAGLVPVQKGRVRIAGREVTDLPAHARIGIGLGFVPQTGNVFTRMTVRENLTLALERLPRADRAGRIEAMFAMFSDLGARPNLLAGALSGGQRQMLATARALLGRPALLILDEPSAGLSPKLVAEVFAALGRIAAAGVTLVLVEQNVRAALALASRAVVLVDGRIAHDGPVDTLDRGRLGQLFLGHGAARGAAA